MCLILFAYENHPDYRLILAANRDEFYRRPSLPASFWPDAPDLLAGRDLEAGGTWLGITRKGRFAALTNYRNPALNKKEAVSRGKLVREFLSGTLSPKSYLAKVNEEREQFNPFNILVGDNAALYYYSPLKKRIQEVQPGLYGLSNAFLDTPWPKVVRGKKLLQEAINKPCLKPRELLEVLSDYRTAEDHHLPSTGVSIQWERILSPIYIKSQDYGTRASSLLLIDRKNKVTFLERSLSQDLQDITEVVYEFLLDD